MMRPLKLLMLLGVLVGTGCSIFESEDPADTARVRLTGTSPVDLELITSSDFAFNIDPQTGRRESVLVESDTVLVRPPYEQAFDIAEFGIFLVRLTNAEQETANVTLEIFIDDSRRLSQEMTIGADEGGEPGRFEWTWLN